MKAKIYDWNSGGKSSPYFNGGFTFEGEFYELSGTYSYAARREGRFFVSWFPAVFEKGNPDNNQMLIFEEGFQQLGFDYPDSLSWTREYEPRD